MKYIIILLLVFTVGCSTNNSDKVDEVSVETSVNTSTAKESPAKEATDIKNLLAGRWLKEGASECLCGECLEIDLNKDIEDFCVESNQIVVSSYYQLDEKNQKLYLYFKEPTDLGSGGARLAWDSFDRKSPLAVIDISRVQNKILKVDWKGFKETKDRNKSYPFGSNYQGSYQKIEK